MIIEARSVTETILAMNLKNEILSVFSSQIILILEKANQVPSDFVGKIRAFEEETRNKKGIVRKNLVYNLFVDDQGEIMQISRMNLTSCHLDPLIVLLLLKQEIEHGARNAQIEKILCTKFFNRRITTLDKRYVKWQIAAQLIWFEDPHASLENVKERLIENEELFNFLEFNKVKSIKNLKNWSKSLGDKDKSRLRKLEDTIKLINPKGRKVGRPCKNQLINEHIIALPVVYRKMAQQINGYGLRLAIFALVQILKIQKSSVEKIKTHPIVNFYESLAPCIRIFMQCWIEEAWTSL
jgi:hypothetical protein